MSKQATQSDHNQASGPEEIKSVPTVSPLGSKESLPPNSTRKENLHVDPSETAGQSVSKPLKAYYVSLRDDDDAGGGIVFAHTVQEARNMYHTWDLDPESWIQVQAHRRKHFDGMEKLSRAELMRECWRDGGWFHESNVPDVDEATDAEFIEWYDATYGVST